MGRIRNKYIDAVAQCKQLAKADASTYQFEVCQTIFDKIKNPNNNDELKQLVKAYDALVDCIECLNDKPYFLKICVDAAIKRSQYLLALDILTPRRDESYLDIEQFRDIVQQHITKITTIKSNKRSITLRFPEKNKTSGLDLIAKFIKHHKLKQDIEVVYSCFVVNVEYEVNKGFGKSVCGEADIIRWLRQLSLDKRLMHSALDSIKIRNKTVFWVAFAKWLKEDPEIWSSVKLKICMKLCGIKCFSTSEIYLVEIFDKILQDRFLDPRHKAAHEVFEKACRTVKKNELIENFIARKNAYEPEGHEYNTSDDEAGSCARIDLDSLDQNDIAVVNEQLTSDAVDSYQKKKLLAHLLDSAECAYQQNSDVTGYTPELYLAASRHVNKSVRLLCKPESTKKNEWIKRTREAYIKISDGVGRPGIYADIAAHYYQGEIFAQNYFMARYLLRKCCKKNQGKYLFTDNAKLLLAKMYFKGEGGLEKLDKAYSLLIQLYREDKLNDKAESLFMLAESREVLNSLGKDEVETSSLWDRAAELGHQDAKIIRTRINVGIDDGRNLEDEQDDKFDESAGSSDASAKELDYSDSATQVRYKADRGLLSKDKTLTKRFIEQIKRKTISKLEEIKSKSVDKLKDLCQGYTTLISKFSQKFKYTGSVVNESVLNDYHAMIHKTAREELHSFLREAQVEYAVAQIRGLHCFDGVWNEEDILSLQRRVLDPTHPLKTMPIYSAAVKQLAGVDDYYPEDRLSQIKLERAARLVRFQLLEMKQKKGYDTSTEITESCNRKFSDHLLQAQQYYTKFYTGFKEKYLPTAVKGGLLKSNQIPFVSTADIQSVHAARYAAGAKVYHSKNSEEVRARVPEYDENLCVSKNKLVGFIFLTLHPLSDFHSKKNHHIPGLAHSGEITVNPNILPEAESTFFASIPAGRTTFIQPFNYPDFDKFNSSMKPLYGIDEEIFASFKKLLNWTRNQALKRQMVIELLGEHISAYFTMVLHRYALSEVNKRNVKGQLIKARLLYRTLYGGFSKDISHYPSAVPFGNEDHAQVKRYLHKVHRDETQLSVQPTDPSNPRRGVSPEDQKSPLKRPRLEARPASEAAGNPDYEGDGLLTPSSGP